MYKVLKEYKNPDFQEKIKSYVQKFNIDKKMIENKIKSMDEITLSIFAKDSSKQNFYEKKAAQYIKKIKEVKNFIKLPNSGIKSLFVDEDTIRKRKDYSGKPPSKSIDFKWIFKNRKYYAFHKYINETGGAQDNQFSDILNSIKVAKSVSSKAIHRVLFVMAIILQKKVKHIKKKHF